MSKYENAYSHVLTEGFPVHVLDIFATCNNENEVGRSVGLINAARSHACASILFADIVGFTSMCDKVSPAQVLEFLNTVFTRFDILCDEHGVHKMETAGDCYVASAGVTRRIHTTPLFEVTSCSHTSIDEAQMCLDAERVLSFGISAMESVSRMRMPHDGTPVVIRVGIHSGPCVSGLVGTKLPKFAIFGDTINTASRMESTAPPGRIQVSNSTMQLIRCVGNEWSGSERNWEQLDDVNVKGKGIMRTFLWRDLNADINKEDGEPARESTDPSEPVEEKDLNNDKRFLCSSLARALWRCMKEPEEGRRSNHVSSSQ
jgi:class 3 adenylate cyclase